MTKEFFDKVRAELFGGSLTETQVEVLNQLGDAWLVYGDATGLDGLAYVMATAYWELGQGLKPRTENLRYTTSSRLVEVWPTRFKTLADAKPYVSQPEKLANFVYAGRLGNGNAASGDGWTFRGRGPGQLTGRASYAKLGGLLKVDLVAHPDLVNDPAIGARILVLGATRGLFTGKKLGDYFSKGHLDPAHARAIINADVAANGGKVAAIWQKFRAALAVGDGSASTVVRDDAPITPGPVPTSVFPGQAVTQPDDPGVDPDAPIYAPSIWQRVGGAILDFFLLLLRKGK